MATFEEGGEDGSGLAEGGWATAGGRLFYGFIFVKDKPNNVLYVGSDIGTPFFDISSPFS